MGDELQLVFHMKGGTGKSSFAQNSSLPRSIIKKSRKIVEESIRELLLWQSSTGLPTCLNVADLGCSSGPNTFFILKEIIINIINKTCWQDLNNQPPPSVQVFLNDLITNDFNTLFKMLPNFYEELEKLFEGKSNCYVAGVPGSFYGRLFPNHSIHFLHSSNSLHWLSQVPIGLVSKSGEQLNKKNICIAETSPSTVREAYMNQFKNDFTTFLKMRSHELVPMGRMVLTFLCKNDKEDGYDYVELLGNTIHDMVSMGVIGEGQLATLNIPFYAPSIEELEHIIKEEDSFTLQRLQTFKFTLDENNIDNGQTKGMYLANCIRAVCESLLTNHFGENCMDHLFEMYKKNASEYIEEGKGIVNIVTILLIKIQK